MKERLKGHSLSVRKVGSTTYHAAGGDYLDAMPVHGASM
jgi:hypothetical protein